MTKKEKDFIRHLENASREVSSWPTWKQTLLGGKATVKDSQENLSLSKRKLIKK
jgi:hypothetical protein